MCGLPNIFEPPKNMTLGPGDRAKFYCTVDMTCMVSYVEWYKQTDNGQFIHNLGGANNNGTMHLVVAGIEKLLLRNQG